MYKKKQPTCAGLESSLEVSRVGRPIGQPGLEVGEVDHVGDEEAANREESSERNSDGFWGDNPNSPLASRWRWRSRGRALLMLSLLRRLILLMTLLQMVRPILLKLAMALMMSFVRKSFC